MTESAVIILVLKLIREKAFRMHYFQSHNEQHVSMHNEYW